MPLENDNLKKLQNEFKKIEFLIIDQFSMLSQIMFGKIDSRLRQAKNNNLMLGGISIILIGDPGQLLPVCASSLYDTALKTPLAKGGYLAYNQFKIVITLEAVMRQQNLDNDQQQAHFIELLPRLRDGTSTIDDWKLLKTRFTNSAINIGFENAISIFNDNDSVDKINLEKLSEMKSPVTEIIAINSSNKGKITSSQFFGNLANSLYFSNECNITLNNNIWGKKGKKLNTFFNIIIIHW